MRERENTCHCRSLRASAACRRGRNTVTRVRRQPPSLASSCRRGSRPTRCAQPCAQPCTHANRARHSPPPPGLCSRGGGTRPCRRGARTPRRSCGPRPSCATTRRCVAALPFRCAPAASRGEDTGVCLVLPPPFFLSKALPFVRGPCPSSGRCLCDALPGALSNALPFCCAPAAAQSCCSVQRQCSSPLRSSCRSASRQRLSPRSAIDHEQGARDERRRHAVQHHQIICMREFRLSTLAKVEKRPVHIEKRLIPPPSLLAGGTI